MNAPRYLHVCSEDSKFIAPYINFIKKHFDIEQHKFLFLSAEGREFLENEASAHNIRSPADIFKHLKDFYRADKIILHALMSQKLVWFLALQPWLLQKCVWVIWGRDLYAYRNIRRSFREKLHEKLRHFVIKRLGYIAALIRADYDIAAQHYGARGQYLYTMGYPSNIFVPSNASAKNKTTDINGTIIQIGNSADPSNRHIYMMEMLQSHVREDMKIICPLSYGGKSHAQDVVTKGAELFGKNFKPLTDFMAREDYAAMQGEVDIAVFAHERQQAMGNILHLLGSGKKVYLNPDAPHFSFFAEKGLRVYDLNEFSLQPIPADIQHSNMRIVAKNFNEDSLAQQWTQIFEA